MCDALKYHNFQKIKAICDICNIIRLKQISPGLLLNCWDLDDGTLIGNRVDLQRAFDFLAASGPAVGLHLNAAKSRVWCGDASLTNPDPLDRQVPCSQPTGYNLLGAPVGDISFIREVVDQCILKISNIFEEESYSAELAEVE